MSGHDEEQIQYLRTQLRKIPEKIARLCLSQNCDLLVLAGDLFDGPASRESYRAVYAALESVRVPVIITPGNHDYCCAGSPYLTEVWPDNVHIFTQPQISALEFPELDCTVYGAGYESMDCPGLLRDFHVSGNTRWHIGVLHGEAATLHSAYCPITKPQIQDSGLNYLALGHVHKAGSLRLGDTLTAWPGCPMGRGFDELGPKGVILVDCGQTVRADFIPLDTPRFFDEEAEAGTNPAETVAAMLPGLESADFYRITLTGYSSGIDTAALKKQFPHIPNLQLRDETMPEADLWSVVGEDTLEGNYFQLLHQATGSESEILRRRATLAAQISRRILDGQEVKLP